jgi:hypothetical protein
MLLYLQFNGRFTRKADRIARIMRRDYGFTRFRGISTSEGHAIWLSKEKNTPIRYEHIQRVPDLWRNAIARGKPTSPANIDRLEAGYGPLERLMMADRHLSFVYLPDIIFPPTALRATTATHEGALACIEELLGYYEKEFTENRPALVLFHNVSAGPAVCAAAVCYRMGIPFVTIGMTQVDNRHHACSNVQMAPDDAIERYASADLAVSDYAREWIGQLGGGPVKTDGDQEIRKRLTNRYQSSCPAIFGEALRKLPEALKPWKKPYLPDPRVPTGFDRWAHDLRSRINYRRNVDSGLFSKGPLPESYVYFAMSWTPEMSTLILAPRYAFQMVVIQALSQSLPAGWKLVVKDHTFMPSTRRKWFYETITRYQNVVLAHPDLISAQLATGARAMATISGTAGWESILADKPTLVFSDIWYLATGLAHRCRTIENLPSDIRETIRRHEAIAPGERRERCARMVQALVDGSVPFDFHVMWQTIEEERLDDYEPDLAAMAERVHARFLRLEERVIDPFDATAWTGDRTPREPAR